MASFVKLESLRSSTESGREPFEGHEIVVNMDLVQEMLPLKDGTRLVFGDGYRDVRQTPKEILDILLRAARRA